MRAALALLALGGAGAAFWYWRGQGATVAPAQPAASGGGTDSVLGNIVDQLLWNIGNNGADAPADEGPMNMDPTLPRGIRNNNPGNIRRSADPWQGLSDTQTDPAFFQFTAPVYGIRALARVLKTYRDRHGLTTVQGIIGRWAPTNENNTGAYVQAVASSMGVAPNVPLAWDAGTVRALVAAIIHHENGRQPYSTALLDDGIRRAGW